MLEVFAEAAIAWVRLEDSIVFKGSKGLDTEGLMTEKRAIPNETRKLG